MGKVYNGEDLTETDLTAIERYAAEYPGYVDTSVLAHVQEVRAVKAEEMKYRNLINKAEINGSLSDEEIQTLKAYEQKYPEGILLGQVREVLYDNELRVQKIQEEKLHRQLMDKVKKGQKLTQEHLSFLEHFYKKHPSLSIPSSVSELLKDKEFQDKINGYSLAELEKRYGSEIMSYTSYLNTGKFFPQSKDLTPKQIAYVHSRYQLLKNSGDITLDQKRREDKMFANLRESDKQKIDAMSLVEISSKNIEFMRGRIGLEFDYLLMSDEDKARKDYSYYRFNQLMKLQPIDWRDPDYMSKRNKYILETGLDPSTNKPATEDEKFVAKHYGWVKNTADIVASISGGLADYSEVLSAVKNKRFSLNSDRLANLERFTAPEVKLKIKKSGYSLDDFSYLIDADTTMSAKQVQLVKEVRKDIGLPSSGTKMKKTIPVEYVKGIVSGEFKTVSGFVSVDSHSGQLKTLPDVYEGNRLDYPKTPYDLNTTESYANISFTLDKQDQLKIPFNEVENGAYPFTGRGFTGSQNIVLPEYKMVGEHSFIDGDMITIHDSKTGEVMSRYGFTKETGWESIK